MQQVGQHKMHSCCDHVLDPMEVDDSEVEDVVVALARCFEQADLAAVIEVLKVVLHPVRVLIEAAVSENCLAQDDRASNLLPDDHVHVAGPRQVEV